MYEDLKMGLKYFKYIEKVALVTNVEWIVETSIDIGAFVTDIPIKTFGLEKRHEALEWLKSSIMV